MKKLLKPIVIAAVLAAGASPLAVMAKAAAPAGTAGVNGIAYADLNAAAGNSAAAKGAQDKIKSIYAVQFSAAEQRGNAIKAQRDPLVDKFQRDRAANAPEATLQQEYVAIQKLEASGKQEIDNIMAPVQMANAYVVEQINEKLAAAVRAAMGKNAISLLLNPQAVYSSVSSAAYDLSPAIVVELDAVLPSVQVQPPAGWVPAEVRAQQAQQAGGRGAASPDGR